MTASLPGGVRHRVVLCADDFGLSEGVSAGILALAEMGRISATGAMTNCSAWQAWGARLHGVPAPLGVGLHVNLTTGRPLTSCPALAPEGRLPPLPALMRRLSRAPVRAEIAAEIDAQLDAFVEVFGRMPDFVDGHQHVHVLPGIRGPFLDVLAARGLAGRAWIRDPSDAPAAILRRRLFPGKALTVRALAVGFGAAARARGFATNAGFSGFSDFAPGTEPERLFAAAFAALGPRPVVMCHPGGVDDALRRLDPVVESRPRELDYLSSEAFRRLLDERRIELVPAPA